MISPKFARFRWVIIGFVLVTLFVGIRWGWVSPDECERQNSLLTQNAAWISVDWTSQPIDGLAVQVLATESAERQLRYLYPYTTYLKPDGTFSPSYDYAAEFVSRFREYNDQTLLLAWIGIPLRNHRKIGIQGWVDLSNQDERQKIVDFLLNLVQDTDFDGVHLNVETVPNQDADYLKLLDEVKVALGPEHIISIASIYWLPESINRLPIVNGYRWSGEYYRAIASRVDQIATMTYDSLMPHPALYRLWMREEVRGIKASLAEAQTELLIGVSVSQERTMTHKPDAENLKNGLAGICAGIDDHQSGIDGVALYAAWDATQADWRVWDEWIVNASGK